MSMPWLDGQLLARSTARVVRREDYESVLAAKDVMAQATAAVNGVQAQLDAQHQQARREGHALGVQQGKDAWAKQLVERHLAGQAQLRDLQPTLVAVVMNALRHLVEELPAEQRFELLARQVIASAIRARQLRLIVAAADAPAAQAAVEAWRGGREDTVLVDVIVDNGLRRGDCVVETEEGAVDGRLEQRLAAIEAALTKHLSAVAPAELHPTSPRSAEFA